jgi:hypothetical protein
MKPENYDYGGGALQSTMHPVVVIALLVVIMLMLILSRKRIIIPFLIIVFMAPIGQQIYFAGSHWLVLRIVIICGCLRMISEKINNSNQIISGALNEIDKPFMLWACCTGLAPILLFKTADIIPLQIAFWIQSLGGYFCLRYLIDDIEDIVTVTKTFGLLTIIIGLCMVLERLQGINIFGYLGGVSLEPLVRGGTIRARAGFVTPILPGCLGATLIPLFFWLWKSGRAKTLGITAIGASLVMVIFSASSTPLWALMGVIVSLMLWRFRGAMHRVRWGLVITLIVLVITMKAPPWFLIARVNLTGASDSYGRAMLIDGFFRHFTDWWLFGTNHTGSYGDDMWDLSNMFVNVGESGGVVALIAFIGIISKSFSQLGKRRKQVEGDREQEWLFWCLCAVMVGHLCAFFGVSYFDQTQVWWFTTLAMVSATMMKYVGRPPVKASKWQTGRIGPRYGGLLSEARKT